MFQKSTENDLICLNDWIYQSIFLTINSIKNSFIDIQLNYLVDGIIFTAKNNLS